MNIVVFVGPPGSGKGSVASYIENNDDSFRQLSTGHLLRKEIKSNSELGNMINKSILDGNLVSDDIVSTLISNQITEFGSSVKSVILDGYPRTVEQAELLEKYIKKTGLILKNVIEFKINDGLIISRLEKRVSCSSCGAVFHLENNPPSVKDVCDYCGSTPLVVRSDDQPDVIRQRLKGHHDKSSLLISYYQEKGLLSFVDASQNLSYVRSEVCKLLNVNICK
ncbi:MAG: adenylate kinase [Candidatus Pelagibacter sp.]|nr:adenylate kinase [Candidatus Pelagibacter sp.]